MAEVVFEGELTAGEAYKLVHGMHQKLANMQYDLEYLIENVVEDVYYYQKIPDLLERTRIGLHNLRTLCDETKLLLSEYHMTSKQKKGE